MCIQVIAAVNSPKEAEILQKLQPSLCELHYCRKFLSETILWNCGGKTIFPCEHSISNSWQALLLSLSLLFVLIDLCSESDRLEWVSEYCWHMSPGDWGTGGSLRHRQRRYTYHSMDRKQHKCAGTVWGWRAWQKQCLHTHTFKERGIFCFAVCWKKFYALTYIRNYHTMHVV